MGTTGSHGAGVSRRRSVHVEATSGASGGGRTGPGVAVCLPERPDGGHEIDAEMQPDREMPVAGEPQGGQQPADSDHESEATAPAMQERPHDGPDPDEGPDGDVQQEGGPEGHGAKQAFLLQDRNDLKQQVLEVWDGGRRVDDVPAEAVFPDRWMCPSQDRRGENSREGPQRMSAARDTDQHLTVDRPASSR